MSIFSILHNDKPSTVDNKIKLLKQKQAEALLGGGEVTHRRPSIKKEN